MQADSSIFYIGNMSMKGGWEREVGKGVSGAPKGYSLRLWSDYK